MKKILRILTVVLAAVLTLSVLLPAFAAQDTSGETVTRGMWLDELVNTFDMYVEEENYPDNYYSDIDADHEFYHAVMLAVEFGVIDVEAGAALEIDDAATREFAASTLNYCLGYQLEEGTPYSFLDSADVTDLTAAQVAVSRGWFELIDEKFLPLQPITEDEMDAMLSDAETVLSGDVLDEDHDNNIVFAEDVVVVPEETNVTLDESGALVIEQSPVVIEQGDRFAVFEDGFPIVFVAVGVTGDADKTVIQVTREGTDGAVVGMDFEGTTQADLEGFVPAEEEVYQVNGRTVVEHATTFTVVKRYAGIAPYGISFNERTKVLTANKKIDLGDGVVLTLVCEISDLGLDHSVDVWDGQFSVVLHGDVELTSDIDVDFIEVFGGPKTVELGSVPFLMGTVQLSLKAEFSATGQVTLVWEGDFEAGFSYDTSSGFRMIKSFRKKSFTVVAHIQLVVGLRMDATLDLVAVKGEIWANIGVQMDAHVQTRDPGPPSNCTDLSAFMYANAGYHAKISAIFWDKEWRETYPIYTESNSPIRLHYHIEDGEIVMACTYVEEDDSAAKTTYYTQPTSKYFAATTGRSTYKDSSGKKVVLYTYDVNDDGTATITGYNGGSAALIIPETIDGYPVTGIGDYAFSCAENIRTVKIPGSVRTIGECAFEYAENLKIVTLDEGLETILDNAFEGCISLTSIDIPDSVTMIDSGAFYGCTALTEVYLPDQLEVLNGDAFGECTALEEIWIPKSLTSVDMQWYEDGPFAYCSALKTVTFEEGVTRIPDWLFSNCTGLEFIEIPDTVTEIGGSAFYGASNLQEVTLSRGLTTIESDVFSGCTSLKSVDIPDSVTVIDSGAFYGCTALTEVYLPNQLEVLNGEAFGECTALEEIWIPKSLTSVDMQWHEDGPFANCSALKTVTFEEGVTRIPDWLFSNCTGLEFIEIPDTVTEIGGSAFYGASELRGVKLSGNLTVIGAGAFSECTSLESVDIPDSVTVIDGGAFYGCTALTEVSLSNQLEVLNGEAFGECTELEEIWIPKSLTSVDYIWGDYGPFANCSALKTVTFEEGVTRIPDWLFSSCTGLEFIEIPDTVTEIGGSAFYGASELREVKLSDNLIVVGAGAFSECTSLESVDIPGSVLQIGSSAFYGCTALTEVSLPDQLEVLSRDAFGECTALEEIWIPKSLTSVDMQWYEDGPFAYCSALKTVTFEEGVTRIPDWLFSNCTGLEFIEIPDTVTEIGGSAFYGASELRGVKLSGNLTVIGAGAFSECTSLESVDIPGSVLQIGSGAFYGCTELDEISVPAGVKEIGERAFSGCSSLAKADLPDTVEYLADELFYDCVSLTDVKIPGGLIHFGKRVFYNCTELREITIPDSVAYIGEECFYNCDSLKTVAMPDAVSGLGSGCFCHCDTLESVALSGGLSVIPYRAFKLCPALKEIVIPRGVVSIDREAFYACTGLKKAVIPREVETIGSNAFSYPDIMTVYGVAGTYAETYANDNAFPFVDHQVAAEFVSIEPTLVMNNATTCRLVLDVSPADCTDAISWKSADTSVVTVDSKGVVTAVGPGTAKIKVVVGDISVICTVTVLQPVTYIQLSESSLTMEALKTYDLCAYVYPFNATNPTVVWSSSDETVATVSQDGRVTPLKKGTATITAAAVDGSGVIGSCTVTVRNTAYFVEDIEGLQSAHNYESNCSDVWVYTAQEEGNLLITFAQETNLEEDFDFLRIYDGNGVLIGEYTGTALAGMSVEVLSETVMIQLLSDESGSEWGFAVASVELLDPEPVTGIAVKENKYFGVTELTLAVDKRANEFQCLHAAVYDPETGRMLAVGILWYDGETEILELTLPIPLPEQYIIRTFYVDENFMPVYKNGTFSSEETP